MQLPTLYKRTEHGNVQQWTIYIENDSFYTIEGIMNGKLTTSTPTTCQGKNVGRANATTDEEQALREAQARWQKQKDKGYFEDIKDIDKELAYTEPMLAKKFEEDFDGKYPVYSETKLDGLRLVVRKDGMWSRNGKRYVSVPHIFEALKPIFDKYPETILDGELYCDKFAQDFNKIVSLVKKTKPTSQDIIESAKYIQYHIFDYISEGKLNFSERKQKLLKLINDFCKNNKSIVVVESTLVHNKEELDVLFYKYLEDGYEGQMIKLDKPYEFKRSKFLLKRKQFQDQEYKILDVVEGIGNKTGMAGNVICELPDSRTFNSNIKGTHEFLVQLLKDKKQIIGQMGTIKFFNLTPDGIPRFPYLMSVRNYE